MNLKIHPYGMNLSSVLCEICKELPHRKIPKTWRECNLNVNKFRSCNKTETNLQKKTETRVIRK